MRTNCELAQHFRASMIVQARDRSADPPRARLKSRGGTDATRELCKAAARRPQQKAARRDQAGERRGGRKNPLDEIFRRRAQTRRALFILDVSCQEIARTGVPWPVPSRWAAL